jgi:DNA-binding response OmpR family regulator
VTTKPQAAPARAAQLPVLIIEDEPAVMAFVRAALERNGYSVVQAKSGVAGLSLLAKEAYLGVLSDMRTPGGVSGADVHAWLAANRPELLSRLLFITGDTANEETKNILKTTGAHCIEKPFRVRQLIAMVERVMGKAG